MAKYFIIFYVVGFSVALNKTIYAQNKITVPRFSFTFVAGIAFGPEQWYFLDDRSANKITVNSMLASNVGLQYGPILKIDGAVVYLSFELGFGYVKTNSSSVVPRTRMVRYGETYLANLEINRIPAMLWFTTTTETKLSPFIRVGAGVSNTSFKEVYNYEDGPDVQFRKWSFTWGIGGGIRYKASDIIDLSIFLDDWITNTDLVGESSINHWENGLTNPFKITIIGIKAVINLVSYN